MKKIVKFLVPFALLIGTLSGCDTKSQKNIDTRVLLSYGNVNAKSFVEVNASDILSSIDAKESFLFVVYSSTCGCWRDFKSIAEPYISENKIIIYSIEYQDYVDAYISGVVGLTPIKGSTTFAIFENGQIKKQINSNNNDEMKDTKKFKNFMDCSIKKPKIYYISEENASEMMNSEKTSLIYFERSLCGDCTYINRTILKKYVEKHMDFNDLYVLDCQPWKLLDSNAYQAKKDAFGLSNVNNEIYGFDSGVFPFFSLIENNSFKSGAVAFNDDIELFEETYKITNSYYTSERLENLQYLNNVDTKIIKGITLNSNEVNTSQYGISWKQESAEKFYEPIINAFLDYALPLQTFTF